MLGDSEENNHWEIVTGNFMLKADKEEFYKWIKLHSANVLLHEDTDSSEPTILTSTGGVECVAYTDLMFYIFTANILFPVNDMAM